MESRQYVNVLLPDGGLGFHVRRRVHFQILLFIIIIIFLEKSSFFPLEISYQFGK